MKKLSALVVSLVVLLAGCADSETEAASFEQWMSEIDPQQVRWIEAGSSCGDDHCSYVFSQEELEDAIDQLQLVTDLQCSHGQLTDQTGYRLTVVYEDQIFQFHCLEDGTVALGFNDADTAAAFGCTGQQLIINNPDLWNFIVQTVECKCDLPQ